MISPPLKSTKKNPVEASLKGHQEILENLKGFNIPEEIVKEKANQALGNSLADAAILLDSEGSFSQPEKK